MFQFWGQATMHTHDLFVNDPTDGHAIERVTELSPQSCVVAAFAFIIEAIFTTDASRLMISSEQKDILRKFRLVR
jgi:hypothetical protein